MLMCAHDTFVLWCLVAGYADTEILENCYQYNIIESLVGGYCVVLPFRSFWAITNDQFYMLPIVAPFFGKL